MKVSTKQPVSTAQPTVSFIVPSYQSLRTLGFTLKSILAQQTDLSCEVLVVDSSEQGIQGWLRSTFPSVRVLTFEKRLTAAAARNRGAQQARGSYLAFLDADAEADADWLDRLFDILQQNSEGGVAGGAIVNANPQTSASRVLYWLEFSEFRQSSPAGLRPFLSSSNLLIGRDQFRASGGFPEELEMSEDLEFSQRIAAPLYFCPAACIRHHHRTRWSQALQHLHRLGYWSGHLRSKKAMEGHWLRKAPLLSVAVAPFRLARILFRLWSGPKLEALWALLHAPLLMVGLIWWWQGFYKGIKGQASS